MDKKDPDTVQPNHKPYTRRVVGLVNAAMGVKNRKTEREEQSKIKTTEGKSNLSKYEKLSILFSTLALVVSLGSPIYNYYWLDPTLQAFRLRARLQVSGNPILTDEQKKSADALDEGKNPILDSFLMTPVFFRQYEIDILNIGQLPAKDIQIVAQFHQDPEGSDWQATPEPFSIEPLTPYSVVSKPRQLFITLNRPLAPQDKLKLTFHGLIQPKTISVSNEFGETTVLDTGVTWIIFTDSKRWGNLYSFPSTKNWPSSPER